MNIHRGLLILFASLSSCSIAADYASDVAKWIEIKPPSDLSSREHEAFMHSANASRIDWVVSRKGDRVFARLIEGVKPNGFREEVKPNVKEPKFSLAIGEPNESLKAEKRILRVDDGWLVGYNAGEFGASLWWFSTNGKAHRKISDHQINQFITTRHGIFAVDGIAHGATTEGSMIQLLQYHGGWTARTFVTMPQSAEAVAVLPDDSFVVVTSSMLLRITPQRDIFILVSNGDWQNVTFWPNSVAVIPTGGIYIGMRQFVVAHDLQDKDQKIQFLLPDRSFLHVEK